LADNALSRLAPCGSAASTHRQEARRPRLEKEQRRLLRERQHKGDEIKRLVAALGSSEEPLASVTKQLAETEALVACLDQRLAEIRNELSRLVTQAIDKDHLTETLSQFEPLWDVLSERERVRIVRLLVANVCYGGSGEIQIILYPGVFRERAIERESTGVHRLARKSLRFPCQDINYRRGSQSSGPALRGR